jgi:hypothetical protein
MDCLRSSRCLLVFDNVETILQSYAPTQLNRFAGQYDSDYEEYQLFFKRVLETNHQSAVVLTSRELPQEIKQRVSHDLSIRNLRVKGLTVAQIQKILHHQGTFQGTLVDWIRLTHCYSGNPLILKSVGQSIQSLFGGNITTFLKQDIVFFDEVCELLNQQLKGLSDTELDFMVVLAEQSKPVSFSEMRSQLAGNVPSPTLLAGLNSLDTRSLLEVRGGHFFLQPLLAGYIRERYYAVGKS